MKKTLLALALLSLTPQTVAQTLGSKDTPAPAEAKHVRAITTGVTRVIDGDTFVIDRKWTPWRYLVWSIRSRGIDTPEKGGTAKCPAEKVLGKQVTDWVILLFASKGNEVRLRNIAFDKYGGRLVADVSFSDGTLLNDYLTQYGYGAPYDGTGPKPNWC